MTRSSLRSLVPALVAGGSLLLAGCSGSGDQAATSSTGSASSSSRSTAPATTSSSTSSAASTTTTPSTSSSTAPPSSTARSSTSSTTSAGSSSTTRTTARSGAVARPGSISLPAIGLSNKVSAMGLNGGAIDPPAGVVQWYTGSVRPGAKGISVIAGHVVNRGGGAGVFNRLPQMSKGDTVTITDAQGSERTYTVYAKEAVNKRALQSDSRVWGSSSTPVIALITCDSSAQQVNGHSVANYVVWAR